jgi:hypothetical protein
MALFIDGGISTLEDLTAQDSQLLDVASIEGIDVTQKLGLADTELGLELEMLLARLSSPTDQPWMPATPGLDSVVCTPALKLWHAHTALALVYGDAYFSQLNDRYKAKRDQFREKAKWAREKLMQLGVGIAISPIPQASTPALEMGPGGSLPNGTYYVTMCWTNGSEEGRFALPSGITTTLNTLVVRPGTPPAAAAGWNVYIGSEPDNMTRQNQSPIAPGQEWQQASVPSSDGPAPSDGQGPSYVQRIPFVFQRG